MLIYKIISIYANILKYKLKKEYIGLNTIESPY